MTTWETFLKDVLPWTPGCPEPVAEHAVRRAAQEYLEATRLWKLWLPDVITAVDRTEYDIELEPKSVLVRLERATLNGCPIRTRSVDELPDEWQTYTSGIERGVHTTDGETLFLLPAQAAGMVLKVEAAMRPSDEATGIEDHIFNRHSVHIAAGAIAALKGQAEKSYSDPAGAMEWQGKFHGHMNVADFQRYRGYSSSRPRRQIRTF